MISPPPSSTTASVVYSPRLQNGTNLMAEEGGSSPEGTGQSQMDEKTVGTNGVMPKTDVGRGHSGGNGVSRESSAVLSTHRKCNRKAEKQTMGTHNANRTEQKQRNQPTESPIVVARQQQTQQSQFNGAQFDTQSLQSRSRSRSIGNSHNPNSLPPNVCHHRQHSSGGFQHGSCTNLSALDGSHNVSAAAGPLVLYNGGVIDGECSPTTMAPHRHSMALIDPPMPSPFWCHQPMLHPHAPPPPFYYSAATLPHPPPPPPMDLVTFRRALKESERMEKERQMFAGERGVCAACCDFCCGGSAVLLWLVLTLVALGFLSFLLIAIYFL
ncbi:hypothetical protein niasHT_015361 [Heterodera trifolii]|uniref:Uncharacterized protein n=1 Tax=Heterodera trifolii TaxID=157864 RepID=A0ABD2L038_9BILA